MDYNVDINHYDITLVRGVNESVRFWDWKKMDDTGNIVPWKLVGKEIRVQFRSSLNDSFIALELTLENGGLTIQETVLDLNFGVNTLNLTKDIYFYDILIVDGNNRIISIRGKLILTGVITI